MIIRRPPNRSKPAAPGIARLDGRRFESMPASASPGETPGRNASAPGGGHLCQLKIQHLHPTVRGDLNVPRFEIAMDDALLARFPERLGDLTGHRERFRHRRRPAPQTLGQRLAFDRFQRHQGRALLDGRHRADEDAIYFSFPERLKESAERAVLRLKWHRSWGDMTKNQACCQRSASSKPRVSASCLQMRSARPLRYVVFEPTAQRCRGALSLARCFVPVGLSDVRCSVTSSRDWQRLHCHIVIQPGVPIPEHPAHPASADAGSDAVLIE